MPEHLILVEKAGYSKGLLDDWPVITAGEYLTDPTWQQKKGLRIVNLCRSQKYLGEGYYCSLLAEARSHKIIPSVRGSPHPHSSGPSRRASIRMATDAVRLNVPR